MPLLDRKTEKETERRDGDKEDMVKKKRVIVCLLNLKDKIILIKREKRDD